MMTKAKNAVASAGAQIGQRLSNFGSGITGWGKGAKQDSKRDDDSWADAEYCGRPLCTLELGEVGP